MQSYCNGGESPAAVLPFHCTKAGRIVSSVHGTLNLLNQIVTDSVKCKTPGRHKGTVASGAAHLIECIAL